MAFVLRVKGNHEKILRKGEVRETHCREERGWGLPGQG